MNVTSTANMVQAAVDAVNGNTELQAARKIADLLGLHGTHNVEVIARCLMAAGERGAESALREVEQATAKVRRNMIGEPTS